MLSTKITIRPHLAEYLYGKYNNGDNKSAIMFPTTDDIYHLIWQLMRKRPVNLSPVDEGNVIIALDERRQGKDPNVYNYLDKDSQEIIDLKIEALFFLELHCRLDENLRYGILTSQQVIHQFMCDYDIDSISEDALTKNNYRWRDKVRKRTVRRKYSKRVK
jgi:hypothetical protein